MPLTHHSLDWNQALLPQVAQRLLADTKQQLIDLSDQLVIVPTSQSGRRLREALALAVSQNNRGLLPPLICTPDSLLALNIDDSTAANDEEVIAAWISVLAGIDLQNFQSLFPVEPIRSIAWQLGMAQRFNQLRSELGEEGLNFQLAAQRISAAEQESERWKQLARLESLYLDTLQQQGKQDAKEARRKAADHFVAPNGVERIILAATPDPQALPLRALKKLEAELPIEVWIYGSSAEAFDPWGRPNCDYWSQHPLDLERWGCQFSTQRTMADTASEVAQLIGPAEPESALIGLANPELNPLVADHLEKQDIPHYDPEGAPIHLDGLGRLCELLCEFAQDDSIAQIRSMIQHQDLFSWLHSTLTQAELLKAIDRSFENHLCSDLRSLRQFAKSSDARDSLTKLSELQKDLQQSNHFASAIAVALQDIYREHLINTTQDRAWLERSQAIRELVESAHTSEQSFPKLSQELSRAIFSNQLRRTKIYPDRSKDAHDLLGWLELLWNDAPHLILAGLNEGAVPESVVGDAFLPESMRSLLGLRTNTQRFARDSYLLEALCRRRASEGQINFLIPHTAADGTPLKPSRILFLGEPDTLIPRTRALFAQQAESHTHQAHTFPWRLTPPANIPLPTSLSVSALKSYLECPFRFFLRHILKLRPIDVRSRELTPAKFGTLFHDSVSKLHGIQLDRSISEADLKQRLHAYLEDDLRKNYGTQLSFALRLQHEALKSRVDGFCQRQLEDMQPNVSIHITDTEKAFELSINDFTIRGTIDRIDKRGEEIELIDYKTADSPKAPEKAHLAVIARKEPPAHLPPEARFEHNGKTYRWIDLQLPLYVLAQKATNGRRPKVAYFNLGNTLERCSIERWEDFSDSHLESAEQCATAVIEQIKAGIFWPPNPDVRENYDEYAALFPDGIENSVDPEAFKHYQFK